MPVILKDELSPNGCGHLWRPVKLQNSLGRLCDTPASPSVVSQAWGFLLQETSRLIKENIQRMAICWAPFSLLSLLASSRQLSGPIKYTLAAFTHMQNNQTEAPTLWQNQIPSIYKQQPNRQASFYNLHFSASCTRIEMCSYFPVTQIATSKGEW